ncbi:MAG TPA: hypothetical protein VLE20_13305, partial [Blastocatellia bacterium]|nr:hypothetical protein [Blastocatellia bacterium]
MRDTDTTLTGRLTQPNAHRRLEPKLVAILRAGYSRKYFLHDLAAGLTVGVVALPLAIAFGIA